MCSRAARAGSYGRRATDVTGRDIGRRRATEELQAELHLAAQELEHLRRAVLAAGGETEQDSAPGENRGGSEGERLQDVHAAADTSVEQHLDALADRLHDLRQHVERRRHAVELPAA